MILGLDISTSITGATVLDKNGKVIFCEAWDTRKYKSTFIKADTLRSYLKELKNRYDIENIYVEQSLQMFRSGFSSAKTLSTLARFNGIVSWLCYEIFNITPEYIAAMTARKANEIVIPRGTPAKTVVLEHIEKTVPGFKYELTKAGNPKPGTYDRADSIVIAKAGHKNLTSSS